MHCVTAKFVPRLPIDDQKEQRSAVSQELRHRANEEVNFTNSNTTGNETWINDMDTTLKWKKTDIPHEGYSNPTRDQKRKNNAKFARKLR